MSDALHLMDAKVPGISVVIPVFNSAESLRPLLERLVPALTALADAYEVLLVDDASRDGSWNVVEDLAAANPNVRGIRMMRNYGQHNALLCGIRTAQHGIVVTMDDDLQHPPEEIPKLLALLSAECDVVYGTPRAETHGFWRDLASKMTKLALQSAMGAETARKVSAFRAFRTPIREAFADYRSPHVSIDILLTWATTRFRSVEVTHDERKLGKSNYNFSKLLTHALNMVTGFSTLPLQLASWIGFAFTLFGLVVLVYVLVRYALDGSVVSGFPFLASVIALFSGAQLFALGIIGEYLARMHFRMMARPTYAVRERASVMTGAPPSEVASNQR
jgi:undecaprenyl-phosphate 4-deoxy-4-formamido-L-arabinose transferase